MNYRTAMCIAAALAMAFSATTHAASPSAYADEFNEIEAQIKLWNDPKAKLDKKRVTAEAAHPQALILDSDKTPVDVIIRRTHALATHLRTQPGVDQTKIESLLKQIPQLIGKPTPTAPSRDDQLKLFRNLAAVRRQIAFLNPKLNFKDILFLRHDKMVRGERHMVDQYLGFNQSKRGGVYVLKNAFGEATVQSLLTSPVVAGRLKGKKLEDAGSFIALDLDYDAKTITFAYTEADATPASKLDFSDQDWTQKDVLKKGRNYAQYHWRPASCFHIFTAKIDGSDLRQLTDGRDNDYDPVFLPEGRIAFISERIGGNQRCGARWGPTATLHRMERNGDDIHTLSFHDTNEWHPSVDNDGKLAYARWDYVDRDSDIAHHLWHCYPDGRDPRSYHGNYPRQREARPWMELSPRAVPNSHLFIATAAPHHGQSYGSLVLIDRRIADDHACSQIKRFTPFYRFPESEDGPGIPGKRKRGGKRGGEHYGNPWPIDETTTLCVFSSDTKQYGIYLLDVFGNREPLYVPSGDEAGCLDPIPLIARKRPPVLPSQTIQAKADRPAGTTRTDLAYGTVGILNVYDSEFPLPKGTKVKELRVVNVFPKPNAFLSVPTIGHSAQSLARGVLGTVPVEADGSVYFRCPTGASIYFQLIDDKGLAIHTMRSGTYLHPGETMTCTGCHEPQTAAAKLDMKGKKLVALAFKRKPSELKREATGSYPLSFPRLVQPVLDAKCVKCHAKKNKKKPLAGDRFSKHGWSEAFTTLRPYAWGKAGGNGAVKSPNKRCYSIPGKDCARVSKLYQMLAKGHNKVELTAEEMRRITLWIDCNSNFYGAYLNIEKQARGAIVAPKLGLPKWIDFDALKR